MTKFWKIFACVALAIATVALLIGFFYKSPVMAAGVSLGAKLAENYDPYIRYNGGYYSNLNMQINGTSQIGLTGTPFVGMNGGRCDLNFGNAPASIAASTSVAVDCQATNMLASATATQAPLTGVTAWSATTQEASFVFLASSTPSTYLGVHLLGCTASTTAGYLTCELNNGTGAAFTPATTTTHWVNWFNNQQ